MGMNAVKDVHESFHSGYRAQMSMKHVRTAADLVRFGAGLRIECGSCGNAITLDGFQVAKACGAGELANAQKRLKCSRCGAREAALIVLSPPPPRE